MVLKFGFEGCGYGARERNKWGCWRERGGGGCLWVYMTVWMRDKLNIVIKVNTILFPIPEPNLQYTQGHNSSTLHPSSPPTKEYLTLLALAGSLISSCSTSSGLITTTRKLARAIGSWRSVTLRPRASSLLGRGADMGVPGGGALKDAIIPKEKVNIS